jgi:hypothetical protein
MMQSSTEVNDLKSGSSSSMSSASPALEATSIQSNPSTAQETLTPTKGLTQDVTQILTFLDKINQISSDREATQLEREFTNFMKTSGLTAEDKLLYQQLFSRNLAEKTTALHPVQVSVGQAGEAKPGEPVASDNQSIQAGNKAVIKEAEPGSIKIYTGQSNSAGKEPGAGTVIK